MSSPYLMHGSKELKTFELTKIFQRYAKSLLLSLHFAPKKPLLLGIGL